MDEQDRPEGIPIDVEINVVIGSPTFYELAEEILSVTLQCKNELKHRIRAVAKAFIDETDEMNRSIREMLAKANKLQLETISPPEMVKKGKTLLNVVLANKNHQEKVRKLAENYVKIAEHNLQAFEEFKQKYGHLFPQEEKLE